MIALIFYLGVALGLGILLYVLARPSRPPVEGMAHEFVEARGSLQALQQGLLPEDLINRIFDRKDLNYITAEMPEHIRSVFLAERKRISLSWVRRIRAEIQNLMHFHRGHSRFHSKISLLTEVRLALDFAGLLIVCRILEALFFLRGPYAAPGLVQAAAATASRLCTASEKSLAFLNVPGVRPLSSGTRQDGAAI